MSGEEFGNYTGVAIDAFAVVPANSDLSVFARALYIGSTGDVVIMTLKGTTVTFTAVSAGTILPIGCKQVRSATTAANIIGLV